ncbi:ComEC/Rec2 family competence protein, partial [candidate division CSSED10-310 bacterium]
EESLLKYGDHLQSTVLKVAHHGSKTSSSPKFLLKVRAEGAVISTSKDNKHGHPDRIVMKRLKHVMKPCWICVTGKCGAITIRSNGTHYDLAGNGKKLIGWKPIR